MARVRVFPPEEAKTQRKMDKKRKNEGREQERKEEEQERKYDGDAENRPPIQNTVFEGEDNGM
jgi:hypothetical protein